ncbi:MAG: PAS domain-containing protein [Planctomycetaceae bacterium]
MSDHDVPKSHSSREDTDDLLQVAAQMAQVGGWELDPETSVIRWTEQTYRIHEISPDTVPPLEDAINFYHPEDRPRLIRALRDSMELGIPYDVELRFITSKGNPRYVRTMCRPVVVNGRTVKLQGTLQDITDQKAAEKALAYERRRLLDVLRGTNAGTWEWNVQTGTMLFDDRWAAMLGYTLEQLASSTIETWRDLCHPDDRQKSAEILDQCFRRELDYYELETRRRHANGDWVWVLDRGRISTWGSDGQPLLMSGLQLDITQRRQTQAALLESEARYRDIFENNTAIKLVIHPSDGRIVEANSAACEFYGYTLDEMMALSITNITIESPNDVRQRMRRVSESELLDFEVQHRLASGELRDVHVYSGPVKTNQEVLLHSIIFDITERKRAEEALLRMQQLESLGTLAGGIAHDFNNVLTGVFGNVSLARLALSPDHPAMRFLEKADQSITRAAGLSTQLLTFAKGGAPVKEHVDLVKLITDVVCFDLSGSNVRPVFEFPDDLKPVYVDKGQLQQVFSNLALNADQAMPDGGNLYVSATNIDVPSSAVADLEPGSYVSVTLRDEGCGIAESDLPRVFEPYFSTKATGHGLGLATSYSIIQRHRGHIRVSSTKDQGTTFTVVLPVSTTGVGSHAVTGVDPAAETQPRRRILVMDDDDAVLDVVSAMLSSIGMDVQTCVNTAEALAAYQDALLTGRKFDLVLLDLTIPGGPGGREAVKRILELDSSAKVLCSSGYTDDRVMADFAEFGFLGTIPKPYSIADLRTAVEQFTQGL